MENLVGQIVEVMVSKNGKSGSKFIKVCKVKARSILFIEVDKENRKNIFWKLDTKNIESVGPSMGNPGTHCIIVTDGILLSDNKWESPWDSIGNTPSPSYARPFYSNHSKGWAPKLACNHKYVATGVLKGSSIRSTTNSRAGFPMV